MNKRILAILIAAAMLFGFATNAQAQDSLPEFPDKSTVAATAGTIVVDGDEYSVVLALTKRVSNLEQVTLDVIDPPISPPWSNERDTMQNPPATRVELDEDTNIVTTFAADGSRLQQFEIVLHLEEVRAEYPLQLIDVTVDDPNPGDGSELTLDGTMICNETELHIWYNPDDSHLYVKGPETIATHDNRLITEHAMGFTIDGCLIELHLQDGRIAIYRVDPWTDSVDPNANWRLSFVKIKEVLLYLPFRRYDAPLILLGHGKLSCTFVESEGLLTITCDLTGAAGH